MSNDLDLYESGGGEVAPYSPSQPLAPTADTWGDLPVDYLGGDQPQLQPDATPQQVQAQLAQLEGIFLGDFLTLGHERKFIDAAARLFRDCVDQGEPTNVRKEHNYNCYQYSADPIFCHIANHLYKLGAPQKFIENLAWWTSELEKRLGVQVVGTPAPVALSNTQNYLDSLDDKEYEEHIRRNEVAYRNTQGILKQRWGNAYHANLAATQAYFNSLPANERKHFDQLVTGGIAALNDPTVVIRLYEIATKQNYMPVGSALTDEIDSIEATMRNDRRRYNSDLAMQARLRTLYDARDGSR